MKKFISMVMTAAMVASLVPATAFAKVGDISADVKVVNAWTEHRSSSALPNVTGRDVPEVQMTVKESNDLQSSTEVETEVILTLDNAKFTSEKEFADGITIQDKDGNSILGTAQAANKTYKWNEYTGSAREDIVRKVVEGRLDGTKIFKDTAAPSGPNTDSVLGTHTTDLISALMANHADIKKEEKSAHEAFVAAVDKVATEGKITAADANTFDTAAEWSIDRNDRGEVVFKNTTNSKAFLMTELEGLVGKYNSFQAIPNANYVNDMVKAVMTDIANDNLYEEVEMTGGTVGGSANARIRVGKVVFNNKKDEATVTFVGPFKKGDVAAFDMVSIMDRKTSDAKVRVTGDVDTSNDYMTYVSVQDKNIKASVRKVVSIAVEEHDSIDEDGVTIEGVVAESFKEGSKVVLRLPRGFNFMDNMKLALKNYNGGADIAIPNVHIDENEAEFTIPNVAGVIKDDRMVLRGIEIDVDSAKAGAKATLSIKIDNLDKVEIDVAEVVDYTVIMSVDKNKEVPVYYSMTNDQDTGLTTNDDHETLEITLEETFPGAWSMRKGFNITVPEGVFVTDVDVISAENFKQSDRNNNDVMKDAQEKIWERAFAKAYQNGDHKKFEFDKRVFDDVNNQLAKDPAKVTFTLTLVADYDFGGTPEEPKEVKIGFDGELVDKQEVTVAKFVKPYMVDAGQNDLKIDARQTKLEKNIVVKEAKDGLWDKNTEFVFNVEKDLIKFEDDAKFTVDKDSELAINDHSKRDQLSFDVKTVGNKRGEVTISDIALFMERNIPQGEYALELTGTLRDALHHQVLFAPDHLSPADAYDEAKIKALKFGDKNLKGDNFVDDVARDKDEVVSKKFINVITARRDEDGFTTRIEVPVGETYIFAGTDKLEGAANSMEVPAYINKDGYTMLPLRAVARALGIANGNIYWSQERQTATVQYGNSRIMTFKLGAKEMIINGHSMPAVAGIEMTNNRLFLSLRDLGVAMNVPAEKIAWNKETRRAYLNPTEEDLAAIKD